MLKRKTKIIFSDSDKGFVQKEHYPVPAKRELPDWYKNMKPYVVDNSKDLPEDQVALWQSEGGSRGPSTIKRCIPVFDAISMGYILKLPVDVVVYHTADDPIPWYRWSDGDKTIRFHDFEQIEGYPVAMPEVGVPVAKFRNPWSIITPPGYSCWFTTPMHRDLPFKILDGTVDTDTYHAPVEFPFFLTDPSWTGLIPAGTPIAQVVPFKREEYEHEVRIESDSFNPSYKTNKRVRSVFDNGYRNLFWNRKNYD